MRLSHLQQRKHVSSLHRLPQGNRGNWSIDIKSAFLESKNTVRVVHDKHLKRQKKFRCIWEVKYCNLWPN